MSAEYERVLLGQILSKPGVIDDHAISEAMFENPDYRAIFGAIEQARNSFAKPDLVAVSDMLSRGGRNDLAATLAGIEYASPGNAGFYAEQLRETMRLHGIKATLMEGAEDLKRKAKTSAELADAIIAGITSSLQAVVEPEMPTMTNTILKYSDAVAQRVKDRRSGETRFVRLGVRGLDQLCNEIRAGEVIVIAGRPGAGKTALALQSAYFSASDVKLPVAVFSMEMKRYEVLDRIVAQSGVATVSSLRGGYLSDAEVDGVRDSASAIYTIPMSVYDGAQTLGSIRSRIRREVAVNKAKAIYIDYLGLIDVGAGGKTPRWERIGEISRVLKLLALDMGLVVVEVVQLGRGAQDQEPTMADLRDSGTIEQDADRVILLYNRTKDDQAGKDALRDVDAIVAKNRHGPCGKVALKFDGRHVFFADENPVHEAPRPEKITIGEKNDDPWGDLGAAK